MHEMKDIFVQIGFFKTCEILWPIWFIFFKIVFENTENIILVFYKNYSYSLYLVFFFLMFFMFF